jgi:uncharacterized membrane protein
MTAERGSRSGRRFREAVRRHFVTGLIVTVPLVLTWWVISAIVRRVDRVLAILPADYHPNTYLPFPLPGLGVIFTLLIILLVGMLSANLFGRRMMHSLEGLLGKIPFVRLIYLPVKQFLEQVVGKDAVRFRRVVLVPYPSEGMYRVGFVTGERIVQEPRAPPRRMLHLFLPNSPNAATGLLFVAAEDQVVPLDLTPDQAFKLVVSAGIMGGEIARKNESLEP